ncbi:MAG TPA: ThuA domain-containing protein [Verrucomicrobiales bacterium]|nr:ThuA domain-containing protein [Verrucomicrobiales bacterium]
MPLLPVYAGLLATGLLAGAFAEPEPWADASLPESTGLALWIDAGRQEEAWAAAGRPALPPNGALLDSVYDASGNRRHARQPAAGAQPRSVGEPPERRQIRFDGDDDFLFVQGPDNLETCTLFALAAPASNAGGFRAVASSNQAGRNDYESGFNLDLGPAPGNALDVINAEGAGFSGARDLLEETFPLGVSVLLELTIGPDYAELSVNGGEPVRRGRTPGEAIRAEQILLGARIYSHTALPPSAGAFFHGDLSQLLLYDHALPEESRSSIRDWLLDQRQSLATIAETSSAEGRHFLTPLASRPPVQILVPGFRVRQLPLDLPNINNVLYRADGVLVAGAYNGNVYLLRDTDGDGLEDAASLYWENRGRLRAPIGMDLTTASHPLGEGVLLANHGKVSFLTDTNGDGRADLERVLAEGWPPGNQSVDAVGLAVDPRDGSIWFAIGAVMYNNAYLIDREGKSQFDLGDPRGTVQRIAPDLSAREVICTGIRFPVALRFNAENDLFAADQEGATWLPNGNPFDELLHIQRARHYGFPPRHPRHLPDVIDEPSVFDYDPQHQSTCGFNFNLPRPGQPVFGPERWLGDAFVTGESRGKIYRTSLVKQPAGYVARTELFASLDRLTVDACLSPSGALVVCAHSGEPDWGTGPEGKGTLYRIEYSEPAAPQPVLAWPESPDRVAVAFDAPLDPAWLSNLQGHSDLVRGDYVRAGDRFETMRPPYEVVARQMSAPRFRDEIENVQVSPDRRTLFFTKTPGTASTHFALTLPGFPPRPSQVSPPAPDAALIVQEPYVDLHWDLSGVEVSWTGDGEPWSGWLPHFDTAVSRAFTRDSQLHSGLWSRAAATGELRLRAQLDLDHMLQPAVQPGAQLDFDYPPESVVVAFASESGPFSVRVGNGSAVASSPAQVSHRAQWELSPDREGWLPFEIRLRTSPERSVDLAVTWHTREDPRPRTLPLRRIFVPWATPEAQPLPLRSVPKEWAGGDWLRGRSLYRGPGARCAQCHRLDGTGGRIGPDLGNLRQRDYLSVLRDIRDPNAVIHPDHATYSVERRDGDPLIGTVRNLDGDRIVVGSTAGDEITLTKESVAALRPLPVSTMPVGLDAVLGPEGFRDLMTYLLTDPLSPAPFVRDDAPPPRSLSGFETLFADAPTPAPAGSAEPFRVVLCAGEKDHGPDEHDYPLWRERWTKLLGLAPGVVMESAHNWPTAAQFEMAGVIVFYFANPLWNLEKRDALAAYQKRGGGLVFLHSSLDGRDHCDALADRIGLAWRHGQSKYRHGDLRLRFTDTAHPVTQGLRGEQADLVDEAYWKLGGDRESIQILAASTEEGEDHPMLWSCERDGGRVFVCIPGHYTWTFDDPLIRLIQLRGLCWAAGQPVDRLSSLATVGARLRE